MALETISTFVAAQILERLRLHGWTFSRDALLVMVAFSLALAARFDGAIPEPYQHAALLALPCVALVYLLHEYLFGVHRRVWQYAGIHDLRALLAAWLVSSLLLVLGDAAWPVTRPLPISVALTGAIFALCLLMVARFAGRLVAVRRPGPADARVLVVGAGEGGQLVVADLLAHPEWRQRPVGFVDDDPRKRRARIHGVPVLGEIADLPLLARTHNADIVAIAIPSLDAALLDRCLALALETEARVQILPSRVEVMEGRTSNRLRDIKLDDLLGRTAREGGDEVRQLVAGRLTLVSGAAGSIGSELCRQLLQHGAARVVALDNNETGLFHLRQALRAEGTADRLDTVLADITNSARLARVFGEYSPELVFHAAAYKHVHILESQPEEAVLVNVVGTWNLCQAATDAGCRRVVFISTDKAVNPGGALGYSKRLGELITRSFSTPETPYCCVRFGNVIGSRGSAVPEFLRQIDSGGPVTVTDPGVTRYFMTIQEAVGLVIAAAALAEGGEVFMLDMGEPIRIGTLVERLIRLRGLRPGKDIAVTYTGLRPGEKLREDLTGSHEEMAPTAHPRVVAVQDSALLSRRDLEAIVMELCRLAHMAESEAVYSALARAATRDAHRQDARLRLV